MSIKTMIICLLAVVLLCGCFMFTGCDVETSGTSDSIAPETAGAAPNLDDASVELLKFDYCINSAETTNVIILTFKLTNCNKYSASFGTSATVAVSQSGTNCDIITSSSLPEANRFEDTGAVHISKGESIEVTKAFKLHNSTDTITIKVSKWLTDDIVVETTIIPNITNALPDSALMQQIWRLGFKTIDEAVLSEYVPDYSTALRVEKIGTQVFKLINTKSSYYVTVDSAGAIVQISSTEEEYKFRTIYYPVTPITYDTVNVTDLEDAWLYDLAGSYSENFARRIQCEVTVDSFMSLFAVNDAAVISDTVTIYFADEAVYTAAKLIQVLDTINIQGRIIEYSNIGIIIEVESFTIINN